MTQVGSVIVAIPFADALHGSRPRTRSEVAHFPDVDWVLDVTAAPTWLGGMRNRVWRGEVFDTECARSMREVVHLLTFRIGVKIAGHTSPGRDPWWTVHAESSDCNSAPRQD